MQGEYTAFHSDILPHLVHNASRSRLTLWIFPYKLYLLPQCGLHASQGTMPSSFIIHGLAVAECHSPLYRKEVIQLLSSLL